MKRTIISGGTLADGTLRDILIEDGVITGVGEKLNAADAHVINAQGMIVMAGLVDLHTHLREPGREDSETVLSGSRAGVKGGYVALSAMANTSPVADTAGVVEQVFRLGESA
ncbi:MAG: dihydroorotase, partial [Actinobacteria bacterium]|nr:dihydroorotase [Actinomycetota bacterium]